MNDQHQASSPDVRATDYEQGHEGGGNMIDVVQLDNVERSAVYEMET